MEEDPSVFEYDSIYDEMTEQKKAPLRAKKDKDTKVSVLCVHNMAAYYIYAYTPSLPPFLPPFLPPSQPKYIQALKRSAERRKLEKEIIEERRVQKEMEKDEDMFGEKEMFLTSAYRQKLTERREMEEELRKEEEREG